MKVYIEHVPWMNIVRIYLRNQTHYAVFEGGADRWFKIDEGQEFPAYLVLDAMTYEALITEAVGPTPTDDVVRDVRNTRDRLLTMVEKLVNEHVSMEG